MKILHTSDWHIGRKLYDRSLLGEQVLFFNWLLELIKEREIELLLVSGDVFDCSMPSGESTELYYDFLVRLSRETDAKAIVTAGNHDSAARLSAPKEFLRQSHIYVLGWSRKVAESPQSSLVNLDGLSVAAFSYIPEGELLHFVTSESEIEGAQRYRAAMKKRYNECFMGAPPGSRKILMGHFFLQGSTPSDSERLVQIGGTLPLSTEDLPNGLDYAALGHLHRPQILQKKPYHVAYSGSPLPMTFKEAEYEKKLFLLEIEEGKEARVEKISIPEFIKLRTIKGKLDEILNTDTSITKDAVLDIELMIEEVKPGAAELIKEEMAKAGGEVLRVIPFFKESEEKKISFKEASSLSPEEVLGRLLKDVPSEEKEGAMKTFSELLRLEAQTHDLEGL